MNIVCDRDGDGNIVDPITQEIIPIHRVVTFEQLGIQYHLDIDTLYRYYRETLTLTNPYNRQPLPEHVASRLKTEYRLTIVVTMISPEGSMESAYVSPHTTIGSIITTLFMRMYSITMITIYDIMYNGVSLYNRYSLGSYISAIGSNDIVLSLHSDTYEGDHRNIRRYKLYRYGLISGNTTISGMLSEYGVYPSTYADRDDQSILMDHVTYGMSRPNIPMDYYTIGITRLMRGSRLSITFVRTIERHLNTLANRYGNTDVWNTLIHQLYAYVVDSYNI